MKAQIQLGESIFVVFIVILLIVFGLVFYAQANRDSIQREANEFQDLETIVTTQYATSLVELKCSLQEIQYPNCFDKTKLDAFKALVVDQGDEVYQEFYFSQLGNARLHIRQVYPYQNPPLEWLIYENEKEEVVTDNLARVSLQEQASLPVSIYDPIRNTYAFGILEITEFR